MAAGGPGRAPEALTVCHFYDLVAPGSGSFPTEAAEIKEQAAAGISGNSRLRPRVSRVVEAAASGVPAPDPNPLGDLHTRHPRACVRACLGIAFFFFFFQSQALEGRRVQLKPK